MRYRFPALLLLPLCFLCAATFAGEAVELTVNFSHPKGTFRALHGGNGGPLQAGGTLDLTDRFKELGTPLLRLHDCHWPNPDVVDIHTLFPNFDADAESPASYDFRKTDEFIAAALKTGAKLVFRLGESIEHTTVRVHVHPPKDTVKWAAICCGIVRHYNDGWASGFHHGIQYWEIWNEPENRPSMWSGSDADYFKLYEVTAKALKSRWPDLKVGGPAVGYSGKIEKGQFTPGDFVRTFLEHCKSHAAPLDFFSWHLYSNDPNECSIRAAGLRAELTRQGFERTEMHLNEWNFLPDNDWSPCMSKAGQGAIREKYFGRIGGPESAAYAASVLLNLQDTPVDAANFYSFENQGFGLFSGYGSPLKPYFALKAFNTLLETPDRVETTTAPGLSIACGLSRDGNHATVLVANTSANAPIKLTLKNLSWKAKWELRAIDAAHDLTPTRTGTLIPGESLDLSEDVKAPAAALIHFIKE